MPNLSYLRAAFSHARSAVRASPLLPLLATVAVATCTVWTAGLWLVSRQVQTLSDEWRETDALTVFLDPSAPSSQGAAVAETLRDLPGIERVRFVTSAEALARLRQGLADRASLLDGAENDLLPPSLDVVLSKSLGRNTRGALARRIRDLPGVIEVDPPSPFVDRLSALGRALETGMFFALLGLGAGCLLLVGIAIRLAAYARQREIEVLRLVGATERFVAAPFWIEGACAGLAGGSVGIGLLWFLHRTLGARAIEVLQLIASGIELDFFALPETALILLATTLVGLVGAHLAVRRHLHV